MRSSIPLFLVLTAICLLTLTVRAQTGAKSASLLVVVNQSDKDVSLVDPNSEQQIATIPEDVTAMHGHEAAVSPDGRTAYVPIYGNVGVGKPGLNGREMLVIDLRSRKITGHVDFGHGVRPHCVVYNKNDGLLYVTTELDHDVTLVDPRTLKIVGTIPTGQPESHMLAISPGGTRGYTANVGPGTVSVLDLKARTTVAIIPISGETQRISVATDGSMAFTSDQTQPRLAVIDTATNKVKTWVPLPGTGYGTAPTKDGRSLLVAIPSRNLVAVVDLAKLQVINTIPVPSSPQEILVRPDGDFAYVSCNVKNQIAVIDLSDWKVQKLINVGAGADGLAWAQ